jgi:hypothetical protein
MGDFKKKLLSRMRSIQITFQELQSGSMANEVLSHQNSIILARKGSDRRGDILTGNDCGGGVKLHCVSSALGNNPLLIVTGATK